MDKPSGLVVCAKAGEYVKCFVIECDHGRPHEPVRIEGRGKCNSGFDGNSCMKEQCIPVAGKETP